MQGWRARSPSGSKSTQHLLGLVNDVLDLAKIEAGEMMVQIREISAQEVAGPALQMVAPQAEARGLSIQAEWDCGELDRFRGDEDRVRQILLNLLSNALKFTRRGGTITLRCRIVETPPPEAALPETGPWVVIEVEDTGSGIPAEQLSRIFEPFVQAEGGHTRTAGGTGLGLTISRRFARLMEGDLTVRSAVGVGSCFSLWLAPAVRETVLSGSTEWPRAEEWPAIPGEVPGLSVVGQMLLAATEQIEEELVERLRADPGVPGTGGVDRPQLADHTAAYLSTLVKMLIDLDEGGSEPWLLQDGEDIQAMLAARHGRQRLRLGWERREIEREYQILHALLDAFVRREAAKRTAADIRGALGVVHRLLDRAEATSLSAVDGSESGADSGERVRGS